MCHRNKHSVTSFSRLPCDLMARRPVLPVRPPCGPPHRPGPGCPGRLQRCSGQCGRGLQLWEGGWWGWPCWTGLLPPSPTFVRMGGASCSFSERQGLAASPWAPCLQAGLLSCSLCTAPIAGKSASTPNHQMGVGLRPGFCDCKQSCPQLSCLGVCVDKWFYFS